jgi:hypothetical protein
MGRGSSLTPTKILAATNNYRLCDRIVIRRLPEPWESKIWSWVPRDSEPRMTVLARPSSNFPDRHIRFIWASCYFSSRHGVRHTPSVRSVLCSNQLQSSSSIFRIKPSGLFSSELIQLYQSYRELAGLLGGQSALLQDRCLLSTTQTQKKCGQISTPRVGFEPMIPVF